MSCALATTTAWGFKGAPTGNRGRVREGSNKCKYCRRICIDGPVASGTVSAMSNLVAITGSSGFLGAALVARFESLGIHTVGLDLRDPDPTSEPSQFYRGDIRDPRWCVKALAGCDLVVHAAAAVPLTRHAEMHEINVTGSHNVAMAAQNAKTFLHVSSSAVYGIPSSLPVRTTDQLKPVERYGRSKLLAENAVRTALSPSTRLTILRPRTVIGPTRGGLFSFLFDSIRAGTALPVFGDATVIQFVHVDDVVDAVVVASDTGFDAPVVNLGATDPRPLSEHLARLVAETGSDAKVCALPPRIAAGTATALCVAGVLPFAPWHTKTYGRSFVIDLDESAGFGIVPRFSNHETLRDAYDNHAQLDGSTPHTTPLRNPLLSGALRALRRVC